MALGVRVAMTAWFFGSALAASVPGVGCGDDPAARGDDGDEADADALDDTTTNDAAADDDDVGPDDAVDVARDTADVVAAPSRPVLNELRCSGSEFVELANPGTTPAPIAGWMIAEDRDDPDGRWVIPEGTAPIAPGGHHVVSADLEDVPLGLGSGLSCGLDTVALYDPAGALVDRALARAGALPDTSWGRVPDAEGPFVSTLATPGRANQALRLDDAPLFDATRVHELDLTLSDAALASLAAAPYELVPATFELVTAAGRRYGPWPVGARHKGKWGSFRALPDKAAFKVELDFADEDRHLEGLTKLTLNNLVQDPSAYHEALAYALFRAVGVPAPEVGYVWLRINGEDYGLYAHVETIDDRLVRRAFPATAHLYEGEYGTDVYPEMVAAFDRDMGDEADRADLAALADAVADAPEGPGFAEAIAAFVDLDEMTRMWAVERWIGHWDGYTGSIINNYVLHADPSGVFRMLPWGTDQTFADRLPLAEPNGVLFRKCFADPACRARYVAAIIETTAAADTLDLAARAAAITAAIDPWLERDPKRPWSLDDTAGMRAVADDFFATRADDFPEWLACAGREEADADRDGHRCLEDCDDDDLRVHPGATDVCGDGVDQDCSGYADDALGCEDGRVFTRGTHRYLVSDTPRVRAAAAEHCAAWRGGGGALLVVDSAAEGTWLARNVPDVYVDRWLGLDDAAADGVWRTPEGAPAPWLAWADFEPNGGDGEQCVIATVNGWADYPCDMRFRAVCESGCAPDGDGDGFATCQGDGDDGDAALGPHAPDVCDDGIDQDTNGRVDDGPDCPLPCLAVELGGARYRFCEDRLDYVAAEAACATFGMRLVVTARDWETALVHAQASELAGFGDGFWLGLDDRADEGRFVWSDGAAVEDGDVRWSDGQPDDYDGGEDCVGLWPWGVWNDYPCERTTLPFVCEAACEASADADGDRAHACIEDCDDGDATIGPDADERCDDGRDDDCDGETDEGECTP